MRLQNIIGLPCALLQLLVSYANAIEISAPIVFPASQNWDGIDGPWSTFSIRLGEPEQVVRVLPSTSGYNVIVPLPGACNTTSDYNGCITARAGIFDTAQSTSWQDQGLFDVGIQSNLGYKDINGDFGLDKVGLGIAANKANTFVGQVIGGIFSNDFYVGLFGLGTQPTNFTDTTQPHTSFFTSLLNANRIPSYTWSYTAGAKYQLTGVLGTMIFGGYDSSKFIPNDVTIPISPDVSRDLLVGLQSITATYSGGSTLLMPSGGIFALVDSTLPYTWLPVDACQAFESAFGLIWDTKSELYLVNETLHKTLLAQNPRFTFKIGISKVGGKSVDFLLPYSAFDLEIKQPFVQNATRYFPLKRAANDTQYTLGRSFLQETYLIADYERGNFSLSQCLFEAGSKSSIVAIKSVADAANQTQSSSTSSSTADPLNRSKTSSIGTSAIIGIIIAISAAIVIGLLLIWLRKRELWLFRSQPHELASGPGSNSCDLNESPLTNAKKDHELSVYSNLKRNASEIAGTPLVEMEDIHPVAGYYSQQGRHEMHDSTPITAELESPEEHFEMFDSSVYREIHSATSPQQWSMPVKRADTFSAQPSPGMQTPVSEVSNPTLTGYTGPVPWPKDSTEPSPRREFPSWKRKMEGEK